VNLLKVVLYSAAVLGWAFLLSDVVRSVVRWGNRRRSEHLVPTEPTDPAWLTVLWRENQYEKSAFTGHLEWLDDERLLIDNGHKTVMVERVNILEMF
jgi:hypothetical protein